jgi:hypothetical protein
LVLQKGICIYSPGNSLLFIVCFEGGQKRTLWYLDIAYHTHTFFALLLFLEEFSLSGNITAVTLSGNIFSEGRYGRAGNNFPADSALNSDFELLFRDFVFQPFANPEGSFPGVVMMDKNGERVNLFAVDEYVEFGEIAFAVINNLIIKRTIALGKLFSLS